MDLMVPRSMFRKLIDFFFTEHRRPFLILFREILSYISPFRIVPYGSTTDNLPGFAFLNELDKLSDRILNTDRQAVLLTVVTAPFHLPSVPLDVRIMLLEPADWKITINRLLQGGYLPAQLLLVVTGSHDEDLRISFAGLLHGFTICCQ